MKLIVGLGNPGRTYANSRHNVGFQCLSYFARAHRLSLTRRQSRARVGGGEVAGTKVVLARPQTFMNQSGESVSRLVRRFNIPLADLLIIYDDLDLALGKIRIRERGGSGGHNGMESIIACLGSEEFPRIRVGIGQQADEPALLSKETTIDYVLSDFTAEEKPIIKEVYARVAQAIHCILTEGIAATMNRYN